MTGERDVSDALWWPHVLTGPCPDGPAPQIAGGPRRCIAASRLTRTGGLVAAPLADLPDAFRTARAPVAGLDLGTPRIMGVVNVTPDSFSDGGLFLEPDAALAQARTLIAEGADILDIGGESTRPGAETVATRDEIARVVPVIAAIRRHWNGPISIDTRKAAVAEAALAAGATILNDVSAMTHDPDMAAVAGRAGVPLCLMHARGDPATMQDDPRYDSVLFDVHAFLAERIKVAVAAGVAPGRIIVDPGIGFGKTPAHNLALMRGLATFHAFGCPILTGTSRKRFIGMLSGAAEARDRVPGSLATALYAVSQGVQIVRVHDVAETRQALALWTACETGEAS